MTKLIVTLTATLGSGVGWWMGDQFGIMTAFILSMIGTGIGIYAGRRIAQHVEP